MPMIPPGQRAARRATSMAARQNGIAHKARRSRAEFDSFDPATANAALSDFRSTHAWARQGDEDEVKKAVAYLLSQESGCYGSKRYANGGPPNMEVAAPPIRNGAREGFGPPLPPGDPRALAQPGVPPGSRLAPNPNAAPGTAASNPAAAAILRSLGPNQWIDDVAADAYLESQRLDKAAARRKSRPNRRRRGLPDGTYEMR